MKQAIEINNELIPVEFLDWYQTSIIDGKLPRQHGLSANKKRDWIKFINEYLMNNGYATTIGGNQLRVRVALVDEFFYHRHLFPVGEGVGEWKW